MPSSSDTGKSAATVVVITLPWRSTVKLPDGSLWTAGCELENHFRSPMRVSIFWFARTNFHQPLPAASRRRMFFHFEATSAVPFQVLTSDVIQPACAQSFADPLRRFFDVPRPRGDLFRVL